MVTANDRTVLNVQWSNLVAFPDFLPAATKVNGWHLCKSKDELKGEHFLAVVCQKVGEIVIGIGGCKNCISSLVS